MDDDFGELVQNFRKKAINLLELLDLSIPSVAKLRVIISPSQYYVLNYNNQNFHRECWNLYQVIN